MRPAQRHARPLGHTEYSHAPAGELADTYPKGRRCRRCHSFLNIYNEGPLCHPCAPGGKGVLIEVADGEWRRFDVPDLTDTERLALRLKRAVRRE